MTRRTSILRTVIRRRVLARYSATARISTIFRDGDVLARYSATTRISTIFRDGDATNNNQKRRTAAKICERYATLQGRNFEKF